MKVIPKWFLGEFIGTFLLVFFGCGAVATAVACGAQVGLFQVAIVWGLGLTSAIYATTHLSGAHFNPAITLAFAVFEDFPKCRILPYFCAQFLGAFMAAAFLYLFQRGEKGSEASAMIFGESYPIPGGEVWMQEKVVAMPQWRAFLAEGLGTALLAFAIFSFIAGGNEGRPGKSTPLLIGLTLTVLISVFAPLTMAGFNPARDLAPRVFSSLAGWGTWVFRANGTGWLSVYILAPFVGALIGAGVARACFKK